MMDRAAQLGRSRDGGGRWRPALATLLALACVLAAGLDLPHAVRR